MSKPLFVLIFLGLVDSSYLTYEHFFGASSGLCPWNNPWLACGRVLDSPYSMVGFVPLALLGAMHYMGMIVWLLLLKKTGNNLFAHFLKLQSTIGILFSVYLVYLQAAVIGAYCVYCLASALISLGVFVLVWRYFRQLKPSETAPSGKAS